MLIFTNAPQKSNLAAALGLATDQDTNLTSSTWSVLRGLAEKDASRVDEHLGSWHRDLVYGRCLDGYSPRTAAPGSCNLLAPCVLSVQSIAV